jgi:precorrin-3B C17-methyltransferase
MTPRAAQAIRQADVVVGYGGYFAWVEDLVAGKECIALPLGQERERAAIALEQAARGRQAAVISSGDPGIYAMAAVVLEQLEALPAERRPEVVVIPGVSALTASAALLGAPLGHDFAAISLSDLLTPWPAIERRLAAAAGADFVIALFNPKSQERCWQLERAREIILSQRPGTTPAGIVRNAERPGTSVVLTTLAGLDAMAVDMFSIVIIGNSTSRRFDHFLRTPRGYKTAPTAEPS